MEAHLKQSRICLRSAEMDHMPDLSKDHIQEHIDLIARHEAEFLAKRTASERLGDRIAAFAGSFQFVSVHLFIFLGWICINSLPVLHMQHFDPVPFSLLGTAVAMEGIILASFILMRQARMGRRGDERDHLMLQILMLTEKELTALLGIDRQVAKQVGLDDVANSPEVRQLSQHTSIDEVVQNIAETIPATESFSAPTLDVARRG